jgi:hypothetical protein
MRHSHMLGITLIRFDGDYALWARHLYGGIGSMDDRHKFQEEMPLEDIVIPDVKDGHLKCEHLPTLVISCSTRHLQVNASNWSG